MCPVPDIQALNAFWLILIYKRDEFLFSEFLGKTNLGPWEMEQVQWEAQTWDSHMKLLPLKI